MLVCKVDFDPIPVVQIDMEGICDEENFIPDPVIKKQTISSSNTSTNQLPSVYESDDSELEDFLDDILERGRIVLKKTPKATNATGFVSSTAMDARLETGVETCAEVMLRKLVTQNAFNLVQNMNATTPTAGKEYKLPPWPPNLAEPWQQQQQGEPANNVSNWTMLTKCFNKLFREMRAQTPFVIENVLQLWLTLNCNGEEDKFDPTVIPSIWLDAEATNSLIAAITFIPGLSLRTWCSALRTLTLLSNLTNIQFHGQCGFSAMSFCIVYNPNFSDLLLRLLSGNGIVFLEKNLVIISAMFVTFEFMSGFNLITGRSVIVQIIA